MPLTRADRDRRHPHQLLIAVLLIITGGPLLLGGARVGSLLALMPRPLVLAWAATFVVGGLAVLAAALVRHAMTALYLELAVDMPIAVTACTYAVAVTLVRPAGALSVWLLYGAITVAFAARWVQVYRTVRLIRKTLEVAAR